MAVADDHIRGRAHSVVAVILLVAVGLLFSSTTESVAVLGSGRRGSARLRLFCTISGALMLLLIGAFSMYVQRHPGQYMSITTATRSAMRLCSWHAL